MQPAVTIWIPSGARPPRAIRRNYHERTPTITAFDQSTGESEYEAGFDNASEYDYSEPRHLTAIRRQNLARRRGPSRRRGQARTAQRPVPTQNPGPQDPGPPQTAAEVHGTQPPVQDVELESKLPDDAVRIALNAEKQCAGLQKAVVTDVVIEQLFDSFQGQGSLKDPLVRAALNAAPLFFLTPAEGSSLMDNRRLWGVAGVVAVLAAKHINFVP